jgi:hypothetical protein
MAPHTQRQSNRSQGLPGIVSSGTLLHDVSRKSKRAVLSVLFCLIAAINMFIVAGVRTSPH